MAQDGPFASDFDKDLEGVVRREIITPIQEW